MNTLTFLQVLKAETMKFQALHPDREAEIARASALITLGMVTASPADPQVGQVLSSDGHTVYHINGVCDCEAGQHGRPCKHVSGWRLYQHIQRKVEAQPLPEVVGASPNNSPLPEAPASVNLKVLISGHEVMVTLRDSSEERLLSRLTALLKRQDLRPLPKPTPRAGGQWKQRGR